MKLVFKYEDTDEFTYSTTNFIPFEYESKEKFIFDILEKTKDLKPKHPMSLSIYELFGFDLNKEELDRLEYNVFELEEWFEKEKENIVL